MPTIRDYFAPTSPCSGRSLIWYSHLPPSREFFTRVCAFHPYDDDSPQAPVASPGGLICVGSTRPGFFMRSRIPHCSVFSCQAIAGSFVSIARCASIPAMKEFVIIMTRLLFSSGMLASIFAILSASVSCSVVYLLSLAMLLPPFGWRVVLCFCCYYMQQNHSCQYHFVILLQNVLLLLDLLLV